MARTPKSRTAVTAVVGVCVGVAALYWAQEFLKPLALAILLSFVLAPFSQYLERRAKFPRPVSVVTVVLLTTLLFVGVGWIVGHQVSQLSERLPEYRGNIERKASSAKAFTDSILEKAASVSRQIRPGPTPLPPPAAGVPTPPSITGVRTATPAYTPGNGVTPDPASRPAVTQVEVVKLPEGAVNAPSAWESVSSYFTPVISFLGNTAIVVVFVIFMLIQREDLRDRVIRLMSRRRLGLTTEALDDAASRVSRYLLMLCLVNGTYGLAIAAGLWIIGVPAAALWGLLCALLRFVPYIGPWIAAAFPITLSIAVGETWAMPLWTLGMFLFIELLSNNVMEPWLYGRGTGVSPMAVIISAAFWTWLWGTPGLLMATPLTVCVAVAGKHVRSLSFLNVLLGDEPALSSELRYYQRLLAGDELEARQQLEKAAAEGGLLGAFQEVALPALTTAERDARRGWLAPDKFRITLNHLRGHIERVAERSRSTEVVRLAQGRDGPAAACDTPDLGPAHLPVTPSLPANTKPQKRRMRWFQKKNQAVAAGASAPGVAASAASAAAVTDAASGLSTSSSPAVRRTKSGRGFGLGGGPTSTLTGAYTALPKLPQDCHPRVLILPARDEPDELAGLMLGKVLSAAGYDVTTVGIASLAGEMVQTAVLAKPDLIIVSATPPAAVAHARYLLKRLDRAAGARTTLPPVLTVLWSRNYDARRLAPRLQRDTPPHLATTLCIAADMVRQLTANCVQRALERTETPVEPVAV